MLDGYVFSCFCFPVSIFFCFCWLRLSEQILIANNGMAGTKAILSMRQWCYLELGDEKAVEFVAMATPEVHRCTIIHPNP